MGKAEEGLSEEVDLQGEKPAHWEAHARGEGGGKHWSADGFASIINNTL